MQTLKIVIVLVLLATVAVFTFQNTGVVKLTFFFWSVSMSSSLLLLTSLFSGILIGLFLSFLNGRKKRIKSRADDL